MAATTTIRIHRMGHPGRKSQNQKSRVTKSRIQVTNQEKGNQNENYEQTCLGYGRGGQNRPPIAVSEGSSAFSVHDVVFLLLAATWWMSRWRRRRYGQRRRGGQRLSWWPAASGWRRSEFVCVCGAEMRIGKSRVELWFGLQWRARNEGGIIKKLGTCCYVFQ